MQVALLVSDAVGVVSFARFVSHCTEFVIEVFDRRGINNQGSHAKKDVNSQCMPLYVCLLGRVMFAVGVDCMST